MVTTIHKRYPVNLARVNSAIGTDEFNRSPSSSH